MSENAEQEVNKFRYALMRKMPFYGDIVMRLPFVADHSIPTAATNGIAIKYNPDFIMSMPEGQRNFVLMHEVFHALLGHCSRNADRNPQLWNIAADYIVNSSLTQLSRSMKAAGIPFERAKDGLYANVGPADTVENLYAKLLDLNRWKQENGGRSMRGIGAGGSPGGSLTVPIEGYVPRGKPTTQKISDAQVRIILKYVFVVDGINIILNSVFFIVGLSSSILSAVT